jgi:hypothetical protein
MIITLLNSLKRDAGKLAVSALQIEQVGDHPFH